MPRPKKNSATKLKPYQQIQRLIVPLLLLAVFVVTALIVYQVSYGRKDANLDAAAALEQCYVDKFADTLNTEFWTQKYANGGTITVADDVITMSRPKGTQTKNSWIGKEDILIGKFEARARVTALEVSTATGSANMTACSVNTNCKDWISIALNKNDKNYFFEAVSGTNNKIVKQKMTIKKDVKFPVMLLLRRSGKKLIASYKEEDSRVFKKLLSVDDIPTIKSIGLNVVSRRPTFPAVKVSYGKFVLKCESGPEEEVEE